MMFTISNLFHKAVLKFLMNKSKTVTREVDWKNTVNLENDWTSDVCCVYNKANREQCLSIIPYGSYTFLVKCVQYPLNCFVIW